MQHINPYLSCPDSKVRVAKMGPTWVLAAPGGHHVGPMNLAFGSCTCLCDNRDQEHLDASEDCNIYTYQFSVTCKNDEYTSWLNIVGNAAASTHLISIRVSCYLRSEDPNHLSLKLVTFYRSALLISSDTRNTLDCPVPTYDNTLFTVMSVIDLSCAAN